MNTSFNPPTLTISPGATITWTNRDNFDHTVTSGTPGNPSGMFDSGILHSGQTFQFTFNDKGTIPYYCRIHGKAMTGNITVK